MTGSASIACISGSCIAFACTWTIPCLRPVCRKQIAAVLHHTPKDKITNWNERNNLLREQVRNAGGCINGRYQVQVSYALSYSFTKNWIVRLLMSNPSQMCDLVLCIYLHLLDPLELHPILFSLLAVHLDKQHNCTMSVLTPTKKNAGITVTLHRRWLTPICLVASKLLGIGLAWKTHFLYKQNPVNFVLHNENIDWTTCERAFNKSKGKIFYFYRN
jgi:hypothetical protein